MKKAVVLTLLLFFNALLIPTVVQSQFPGEKIVLSISNPLNYTRTDEPVIIRWINLTESGIPETANPDSFRVTDEEGNEISSQFDDLTDYGYEKYLVFPATVEGSSNATYYLYYTTGLAKPEYAAAVNMTETDANYTFTAETYSGVINKATGVMENITTTHSGTLLTNFGGSSYGAPGWAYGWYQVGSTGAQINLLKQGPVRSIIAVKGEIWYTDKEPYPGSSDWNFTTIYLLYKDRVEALTHQVYTGTAATNLMQARVGISHSVTWMLNGPATLDTPNAPFTQTIQDPYAGYSNDWSEYAGCVWTIYPIRDNYPENGRWTDITSENGTFGYGAIFYDSANIIRIELGDGRSWGATAQNVTELNFIQYNAWPSGPVPPGLECRYHWALIPHENENYTFTQAEAQKAYYPLGFKGEFVPPPKQFPVWIVYLAFFAAAAAIMIFFARKSLKSS